MRGCKTKGCEVALKCNKESSILIYQMMALCPYDRDNWPEITALCYKTERNT